MELSYESKPQVDNYTNDKYRKLTMEKAIPKVVIYVDRSSADYYLDYATFMALAFHFNVDGTDKYDLGNNTYKGDLQTQSVTVDGHPGLLPISNITVEEIKKSIEDIEYVELNVIKEYNPAYDINQYEDQMNMGSYQENNPAEFGPYDDNRNVELDPNFLDAINSFRL